MRYMMPMIVLWLITFLAIWFRKDLPDRTFWTALRIMGTSILTTGVVAALVAAFVIFFD